MLLRSKGLNSHLFISDLDECKYDQFCDQPSRCTNTEHGYSCSCREGYELQGKNTCKAINGNYVISNANIICTICEL